MKLIRPIDFYTKNDEPLLTREAIPFFLEYKNTGDEEVERIPAEIVVGGAVKTVSLPGLKPSQSKTVEMVLMNNISDEITEVGVVFGEAPTEQIHKHFKWMGQVEIRFGEMKRAEFKDTETEIYYRIFVHNTGTSRAKDIEIYIEKDNEYYGRVVIPELAPRTSTPVNLALNKNVKGLVKISVNAKLLKKKKFVAGQSFHITVTS